MPTKIEWVKNPDGSAGETWNPIRARNKETGRAGHFCVHVSPACQHCYAEVMQPRLFGNPIRYAAQDADKVELFLHQNALWQPLRWRRPRRIFVCSMTDLFYEGHSEEMIDQVFAMMALASHHQFQVLTKRPERMAQYLTSIETGESGETRMEGFRDALIEGTAQKLYAERTGEDPSLWLAVNLPLPNVWLGVSVEDRARKERIDRLRETEAAVRFLSIEPLLENLGELDLTGIDWVISGGESGCHARPSHPDWFRSVRDQCIAAGVPYLHKQNGEWAWYENMTFDEAERSAAQNCPGKKIEHHSCGRTAVRVGKKKAGRQIDGRMWDEFPREREA